MDGNTVSGAASASYTPPTGLSAGDHEFYCAVTCDDYTVDSQTSTITGATTEKVYDGTTAAPAGLSITLDGVVSGDNVTASVESYAYDSAGAGDNKTITAKLLPSAATTRPTTSSLTSLSRLQGRLQSPSPKSSSTATRPPLSIPAQPWQIPRQTS